MQQSDVILCAFLRHSRKLNILEGTASAPQEMVMEEERAAAAPRRKHKRRRRVRPIHGLHRTGSCWETCSDDSSAWWLFYVFVRVNLSKRGGKDGVFRGLAGLLRGISRGRSPREIPRFRIGPPKCTDGSVLAFLKCTDGSVLAFLNPYGPSWIRIGPPESVLALLKCIGGEFWCTLSIM